MPSENLDRINGLAQKRGSPFRVLIVDDEEWIREAFREFCGVSDAFVVDLAGSGAEAIEKAGQVNYDLIAMDIVMPDISGLAALEAIKKASPRVQVMVITGNATDKLIYEAGVLGAANVLHKPFGLEEFIARVAAALER
jgi:DNA-binding response OmpR family regulator